MTSLPPRALTRVASLQSETEEVAPASKEGEATLEGMGRPKY